MRIPRALAVPLACLAVGAPAAMAATVDGDDNANLLRGTAAPDLISGRGGNDLITGFLGPDTLRGEAGNDVVFGGRGRDLLLGGTENDALHGGPNRDVVLGQAGDDVLSGGLRGDVLSGGTGDDRLDGGTGNDTLVGGDGSDTYVVDSSADIISETGTTAGNIDSVISSVSWTLQGTLENLTLTGSTAVRGNGNSAVNLLIGNAAGNTMDAGAVFWAVRGGGGNFGVVTAFLFRGQEAGPTVYGGPIFWPLEYAADVMRQWRDLILSGPEELNGWFGFHTVPPVDMFPAEHHLKKMAVVTWCYTGDLDAAEQVFAPIRAFAPPAIDFAGPIPLATLQSLFDGLYPPGLQWYWNADYVTDLGEEAIALHTQYAAQLPSVHSTMHLYPINGAAHRVGPNDTAWSFREANFVQVIVGVDPDPANNARTIGWSKEYWRRLHPYSAGGAYVNMMMDEGQERVMAAYRDNYARLAQVKARYDPDNFFHVNQNIRPAR